MPEPPCFEEVHWRVLKNSIKVSPRQITLLEKLLSHRTNPETCQRDTAGKRRNDGTNNVDVNRPIQATTRNHKLVYCECDDWQSRRKSDQKYCELPMKERGVYNLTTN